MNFDDFRPMLRNTRLYLNELEAFVEKFIPWQTLVRHELGLLPSPDEEALRDAAAEIARRMVYRVAKTNANSWRAAARQSMHARRIYEALRAEMNSSVGLRVNELIAENARLILGLPEDLAQRTAAFIGREQRRPAGRRDRESAGAKAAASRAKPGEADRSHGSRQSGNGSHRGARRAVGPGLVRLGHQRRPARLTELSRSPLGVRDVLASRHARRDRLKPAPPFAPGNVVKRFLCKENV
jgi:hypothetical protein